MQNVLSPLSGVLSPEEEATAQEQEKMINISYELAAEASKRSKLVAGTAQHRTVWSMGGGRAGPTKLSDKDGGD